MSTTPNKGLPLVPEGTLDPAAGLNDALNDIDAIDSVTRVISIGSNTPPAATSSGPSDGDLYIVGTSPTGAWSGHAQALARYVAEGEFWLFYEPGTQVAVVLNQDDGGLYKFLGDSSGWTLAAGIDDAPIDGTTYGRNNGAWVATGSSSSYATVTTETGTARAADPSDAGKYIRFTNAAAKTYTFDDGEGYTIGQEFHVRNVGAGNLTLVQATGMVLNAPYAGTLVVPQNGTVTVKITASGEADVFGQTVPA